MIRLLDLTHTELSNLVAQWGQPSYRADQIWQGLYARQAISAAEIPSLPRLLKEKLEQEVLFQLLEPITKIASTDGQTHKFLFRLLDGQTVEAVLMLYEERRTLCISTQAGCGMGCVFCATAQGGLARNLTAGEIVAQVLFFARWLDGRSKENGPLPIETPAQVTNVVLMGMGEPLANYRAVWQALNTLTDSRGVGIGARRFTLSTVGLVPMIDQMADEPLQINLAVSLHAPNDELRSELVPINKRYPISELMASCRRYIEKTHRRVSFEYALMHKINDHPEQATQLANLLKGMLCHVNLIPLNPVTGSPFQPSKRVDTENFTAILREAGISTTVRLRRGIEINAGCGQLRSQIQLVGLPSVN